MHGTSERRAGATRFRIRRDLYERRVAELGAESAEEQVLLTGVSRTTLWRIRNGAPPSLANADRIAHALGVPIGALFERVDDAA